MTTADDFVLFVLWLAVELELGAELDDVALTVSCPEISEEKRICGARFHDSVRGQE
jgi:hypothetical protein